MKTRIGIPLSNVNDDADRRQPGVTLTRDEIVEAVKSGEIKRSDMTLAESERLRQLSTDMRFLRKLGDI